MPLVPINEILLETFKRFKLDNSNQEVYEAWDDSVGNFAKHAQVVSVDEDKIVVNVDNSVFLQELVLRKKEILEKLNAGLKRKIKEIKFRAGKID